MQENVCKRLPPDLSLVLGSAHDFKACNDCSLMNWMAIWDREAKLYVTEHQKTRYHDLFCNRYSSWLKSLGKYKKKNHKKAKLDSRLSAILKHFRRCKCENMPLCLGPLESIQVSSQGNLSFQGLWLHQNQIQKFCDAMLCLFGTLLAPSGVTLGPKEPQGPPSGTSNIWTLFIS